MRTRGFLAVSVIFTSFVSQRHQVQQFRFSFGVLFLG